MNNRELYHSDVYLGYDFEDGLMHWKYIDRFKGKAGKWVYVYSKKAKANANKAVNNTSKGLTSLANKAYTKVNEVYDKTFKNNIYATNSWDYDRKIKEVEKTKEWQDIVARKDPEYVVQNKDGTYTYKIDDYLIKKKHQALDVLDDIVNGREITTNDVSAETLTACAQDYIQAGLAYVAVRAKILMEAMKFRQGSYDKKIAEVQKDISDGKKAVESIIDIYSKNANTNISVDTIMSNPEIVKLMNDYDKDQIEELKNYAKTSLGSRK